MSSRNGCFRKTPGLRIRPVPEMGYCFVFTPANPHVFTLNPAAWLILELCDGQTPQALLRAYRREAEEAHWNRVKTRGFFSSPAPPSRAALHRELEAGVRALEERRIIAFEPRSDAGHSRKARRRP